MLQGDFEALNSIGSVTSVFITSSTLSSVFVNIFLAASLRLVWKMLGAI